MHYGDCKQVFHYLLFATGDTAMPGGQHASLCHVFLVIYLFSTPVLNSQERKCASDLLLLFLL